MRSEKDFYLSFKPLRASYIVSVSAQFMKVSVFRNTEQCRGYLPYETFISFKHKNICDCDWEIFAINTFLGSDRIIWTNIAILIFLKSHNYRRCSRSEIILPKYGRVSLVSTIVVISCYRHT